MKALLIYHKSDSDGLLSRSIASRALRDKCETLTEVGWDYGDPTPYTTGIDEIWMVDISVAEILDNPTLRTKVRIIDHHKTVVEKWGQYATEFALWIVDTRFAACRLVNGFFLNNTLDDSRVQRIAFGEDDLTFLVGLRDIWKHNGTEFETDCQHLELGMRSDWPPDFDFYFSLGDCGREVWIDSTKKRGEAVSKYAASQAKESAERGAMVVTLEGLRFLTLNTLMRGSMILDAYSKEVLPTTPHDALMVWAVAKDCCVVVSLYHASHNKEVDLSQIAKKHGGGGHPGACGFRTTIMHIAELIGELK